MFHGVVFTKNIAHKKMKSKVVNPLILLLRGTIEFQRVEQKFSSLEPQILQVRLNPSSELSYQPVILEFFIKLNGNSYV